jgi:hypothetical protein
MKIIENNHILLSFCKSHSPILLMVPVWSSPKAHQFDCSISFVYLRTKEEEYIINFNHIDAQQCQTFKIDRLANPNTLVLGNRYIGSIGIDYEWAYFEENGKPFIFNEFAEGVYKWYRYDFKELNDCVPLLKWYEILTKMEIVESDKKWYRQYSSAINLLGRLEGAGVKVVEENFIDSFSFPSAYLRNGFVFTQYNPYTITGRPSNRHLNINYSALNKSDGSRSNFISRFDKGTLIQFDYESYHIRLIGKLVGYDFPLGETAHQHLAKWYGMDDYNESKGQTFKYLYGGLDDVARQIPFFQKVDTYIKDLWKTFVISGKLTTPLYKREIIHSRIESPNEQKVFNYLLQALETEVNYGKLREIMKWLDGRRSKLILYTYDAFLIDTHSQERNDILNSLTTILEKGNFPVRAYEGKNYNNLEVIS